VLHLGAENVVDFRFGDSSYVFCQVVSEVASQPDRLLLFI
jgi:hypothetical protein